MSILELLDLLLLLQLVVLHRCGDVVCVRRVLWVEHMRAKIEHGLLVAALLVRLSDLPLTELLNKL